MHEKAVPSCFVRHTSHFDHRNVVQSKGCRSEDVQPENVLNLLAINGLSVKFREIVSHRDIQFWKRASQV